MGWRAQLPNNGYLWTYGWNFGITHPIPILGFYSSTKLWMGARYHQKNVFQRCQQVQCAFEL